MSDFVKLEDMILMVNSEKLVLPDFQRKFVWDTEKMISLYSSILCQMPIGSILTLTSDKPDFACKKIGAKSKTCKIQPQSGSSISYLLDGQQRLTSLFAGFTTFYFKEYKDNMNSLASRKLINLYFLKIPSSEISQEQDLFNIRNLNFDLKERKENKKYFSTSDITEYDLITYKSLKDVIGQEILDLEDKDQIKKISNFCTTKKDGYYFIPLQFINASEKNAKKCFKEVMKSISEFFDPCNNEEENKEEQENWVDNVTKYLEQCLSDLKLNEIKVDNSDYERAIDIYSNLNQGGIALDIFDLIMAKVGTVSDINFYERFIKAINDPIYNYPESIFPNNVKAWLDSKKIVYNNAAKFINIVNENTDSIEKIYINIFLNAMGLYVNKLHKKEFDVNATKEKNLLKIKAEYINESVETVCKGLDRAIFFFQNRCGIRKLNDINYKAQVALIAYFFTDDSLFERKEIHCFFECWYWISIFARLYPSNQNIEIFNEIPRFERFFAGKDSAAFDNLVKRADEELLNVKCYSDRDTLLMKNTKYDQTPPSVISKSICQFYLAYNNGYKDFKDCNIDINAFFDSEQTLEMHHIIPLKEAKTLKESTKQLRQDKTCILNSPLNMLYISKKANLHIGDMAFSKYSQEEKISEILSSIGCNPVNVEIENFLEARFNDFQSTLKKHLGNLKLTVENGITK